ASPLAAERMGAVASTMPAARRRDDKSSSSPDRTRVKLQDDAPVILNTIATSKYLNIIKSCESTDNQVEVARVRVNDKIKDRLQLITLRNQWPLVFIKGDAIGGLDELKKLADSKILAEWLKDHKYDLIVVGGGSGGLAAAKMAA
ncbi:hypothetical protein TELCIR_24382, partial [Teladorsagia circumcincta]